MDSDSPMVLEANHDPAGQNGDDASSPTGEAVNEREHGGENLAPPSPQAPQRSPRVVGPRHAPTYSLVNAKIERTEDCPGPRCGHTLTAVAAVGEEGRPGYLGPRLIMFGGATALEGNPFAAGPPSSAGSAGIRIISAFLFDALCSFFFLQ